MHCRACAITLFSNLAHQKNKPLRTVVNKLDTIDTQFRFFKMELLAGEPDYIVEHVRRSFSHYPNYLVL